MGRLDEASSAYERAQRYFDKRMLSGYGLGRSNLSKHAKLLRQMGDDAGADRLEAQLKANSGR